ncbi:hypothetical protein MNB_SV-12-1888 [hydrothermal vent metagenome]|uniref:Cytochrome c-552/4 domain-containing protein n=1 Tax=hydrothermal vent metagenome TaxID=652676 RepID=A0A1W1BM48_9ZZZZ
MRLTLALMALLSIQLSANNTNTCRSCHPTIYNEFQQSFHKKSNIKEDKVHKAIWDKHPLNAKGDYKCAKCHSPDDVNVKEVAHKGINCITCHSIIRVENHPKSNTNIYETKPKTFYSAEKGSEDKKVIYQEKSSWLGLIKETTGSPYHDIDYTNKNFYTGQVCVGCHSHKQNGKGFVVCKTDLSGAKSKETNCITCHMPKIKGTITTIKKTATHAFHGFAGVRNASEMLSKYVELAYKKSANGFEITIHNNTPHNLMTHPLRVVELKTTLKRDGKTKTLQSHTFVRAIGTGGKPAMPWLATEVVKDNMLKANEKRVVSFDEKLQSGDEIETVLGFYIVNPKVIKKLGLENDKKLSEFTALKSSYFSVK